MYWLPDGRASHLFSQRLSDGKSSVGSTIVQVKRHRFIAGAHLASQRRAEHRMDDLYDCNGIVLSHSWWKADYVTLIEGNNRTLNVAYANTPASMSSAIVWLVAMHFLGYCFQRRLSELSMVKSDVINNDDRRHWPMLRRAYLLIWIKSALSLDSNHVQQYWAAARYEWIDLVIIIVHGVQFDVIDITFSHAEYC